MDKFSPKKILKLPQNSWGGFPKPPPQITVIISFWIPNRGNSDRHCFPVDAILLASNQPVGNKARISTPIT